MYVRCRFRDAEVGQDSRQPSGMGRTEALQAVQCNGQPGHVHDLNTT